MEKIDRLGWAAGLVVSPFGTRLGIRTNDVGQLDSIASTLPANWDRQLGGPCDYLLSLKLAAASQRRGSRNFHLLYAGSGRVARTLDSQEIFTALREQLLQNAAITARSQTILPGVLLEWEGRGVLVVGQGLDADLWQPLLDAGGKVCSQSMVSVDAEGMATPWPGQRPAPPLRLSGIFASDASRRRRKTRLERLKSGKAALILMGFSQSARYQPQAVLQLLANLCQKVPVLVARHPDPPGPGLELLQQCRKWDPRQRDLPAG